MKRIVVAACAVFCLNSYAWFLNADQQGERALKQGKPAIAAELFKSKAWKGVAHYRAGQYQKAVDYFSQYDQEDAHFNRGNALAHLGRYQQAIAAYDKALQLDPDMQDAKFNRDLIEKLLQQQEKNQQQQDQKQQQDQQQSDQAEQQSDQQQQQDQKQQAKQDQEHQQQERQQEQKKPQPAQDKQPQTAEQQQQEQQQQEQDQAEEQWLSRIPDDPGGLLRRKFLRDHQRRQQEKSTW